MTAKIYNLDDYRPMPRSNLRGYFEPHENSPQSRSVFAPVENSNPIPSSEPSRRCTHCNRRAPAGVTDDRFFLAIFADVCFCDINCINAYEEK